MFNRKLKHAKDSSTIDITLTRIAQSSGVKVRAAVAANPNVQVHMIHILAVDKDRQVRMAAATNPRKMSLKLWNTLNEDEDPKVVAKLLEHYPEPPAPPKTFRG